MILTKEWQIRPREPLNTRIWGEIAAALLTNTLVYGDTQVRYDPNSQKVQLFTPESVTKPQVTVE